MALQRKIPVKPDDKRGTEKPLSVTCYWGLLKFSDLLFSTTNRENKFFPASQKQQRPGKPGVINGVMRGDSGGLFTANT